MKTKAKQVYHGVSILMLIVMGLLYLFVSNVYPQAPSLDTIYGMIAAWILQYILVNGVMFLDRKNLIN